MASLIFTFGGALEKFIDFLRGIETVDPKDNPEPSLVHST